MADQDGLASAAIGIIMSFREIFLKKNGVMAKQMSHTILKN